MVHSEIVVSRQKSQVIRNLILIRYFFGTPQVFHINGMQYKPCTKRNPIKTRSPRKYSRSHTLHKRESFHFDSDDSYLDVNIQQPICRFFPPKLIPIQITAQRLISDPCIHPFACSVELSSVSPRLPRKKPKLFFRIYFVAHK